MKYIYRPTTKDFVISAERMALLLQRMGMTKEKCQEMDDKTNAAALKASRGEIGYK